MAIRDYLEWDNQGLSGKQVSSILSGYRLLCIDCGRALTVSNSEQWVVMCACGNGYGHDAIGLYYISKSEAQEAFDTIDWHVGN